MSMITEFSMKDRTRDHEAVRLIKDIVQRHQADLSGADITAFTDAIAAVRRLERRLSGKPMTAELATVEDAWAMGETRELDGGKVTDNPFQAGDPRETSWDLGFRQIPTEWKTR